MSIKDLYVKFRICIDAIIKKYQWKKDAKFIRKTLSEKELLTIDKQARILILAPHSDDEWIGCSQIVRFFPNSVICNMNMQGEDDDAKHNRRIIEMIKVAELFNRPIFHRNINNPNSLSLIIQDIAPDYICLPFFIDWHDEHREVMKMLKDVVISGIYSNAIICYQVSVPIPSNVINYMMPMTKKEQKQKWKTFEQYYKSQLFMPVDRFKAQEKINGALCNSYSAEAFVALDSVSWLTAFESIQISKEYKDLLKKSLNNIGKIRRIVRC